MSQFSARAAILIAALCLGIDCPSASASPQSLAANSVGERSGWIESPLPLDFGGPGSVKSLGTSTVYQTPSQVHLWSAITARWTVVPVSTAAQVRQFNDYVTIQDGTTIHGYTTRNAGVETLQLPAAATVFNGQLSSCWLSIAVLGTDAWAFSAFDGKWHHQALITTTPNIVISQTTGIIDDGGNVYGISTYYGNWVPVQAPVGSTIFVGGDLAVAWSTTGAAGFSAHTNTWASHGFVNGVALAIERGYAMFQDGGDLIAFSSCTGTFNQHTPPAGFSFIPGRYVAAATAGSDVVAYSSSQNIFQSQTFQFGPAVSIDDEVLAVQDSAGVTAFSVVTGAFSATIPGAFTITMNDAMVWIGDGSVGHAYSSVLGTWSAPVALGPQVQVTVLRNAVVLTEAQQCTGFSGRTGDWVVQPMTSPYTFDAPNTGDVFAAFEGLQVRVFDPVLVRWATIQTSAPLVGHDIWRQTFVGFDGTMARGFGLMNNVWSSIRVHGAFQQLDANDACGFLITSSHIYAYSGHGSLSTLSRFPEFSRLQPLNAPLRLFQSAPAGSSVIAMLALQHAYIPVPLAGTLYLDPASIFRRIPIGTVPASGLLEYSLDLTSTPALQGAALHVQNYVLPQSGPRWLTNSIAPIIL
ncbi:MAG TPA: hypothetical protein VK843_18830 [Planctomycetota bacterium]|nr:hypothetical protein [Planctomycetota bacterium]